MGVKNTQKTPTRSEAELSELVQGPEHSCRHTAVHGINNRKKMTYDSVMKFKNTYHDNESKTKYESSI